MVKYIEYIQVETVQPSIMWVKFDDAKAGMETRMKYMNRGFYHNQMSDDWTPVFDAERTFIYYKKNQRIQFSLQPSAGRSVYRALKVAHLRKLL